MFPAAKGRFIVFQRQQGAATEVGGPSANIGFNMAMSQSSHI
jgi:hypothetical protein